MLRALLGIENQYDVVITQPEFTSTKDSTLDQKRKKALEYLGDRYLLKGGSYSRYPTVLNEKNVGTVG